MSLVPRMHRFLISFSNVYVTLIWTQYQNIVHEHVTTSHVSLFRIFPPTPCPYLFLTGALQEVHLAIHPPREDQTILAGSGRVSVRGIRVRYPCGIRAVSVQYPCTVSVQYSCGKMYS